jgi:glycosyltransferase involved in cell wall biosynthesis
MSGIRILHAIRSNSFAGVEQFVRRLAIAQARAGHDVHVIGGDPGHMAGPLAEAGVGFEPADRTATVAAALRASSARTDVVNTHMTAADIAAVRAFTGRSRPAVVSTRHFAQRRGRFRALPLDPLARRVVDAEISVSTAVAEAIGLPSTVVRPGIEPPRLAPVAGRGRVILVVQRLQPEKQTVLAIEAFARSGLAAEGWRLDIAGSGAEAESLSQDAAVLGDAARMLGFRDDVPQLMASAGILLATAPFEHFGLTVLEAMASGLPVVAAAAAGHLETMAGLDDGALFTAGDADAGAAALRAFAVDPERRRRLGEAERARVVRDFSVAAQVEKTDAVYRAAIAARSVKGST